MDENKSFIEWRKQLAELQEKFPQATLTPYEKNFEVWKQLWHVVEKADVLIQIIDGRNPLFFRCEDLDKYVSEVSKVKKTFLLVNKADLIPATVRKSISAMLTKIDIRHAFFSALVEQEKIDIQDEQNLLIESPQQALEKTEDVSGFIGTDHLFDRHQLLSLFQCFKNEFASEKEKVLAQFEQSNQGGQATNKPDYIDLSNRPLIVGMVGFPNVGKSSAINAVCGKKKVGVDCKPGKTKNLQTIILSPYITLCDCPGLVFPSVVSSKAEMTCNGVLSVESTIMEFIEPVEFILSKVPTDLLGRLYKLPLAVATSNRESKSQSLTPIKEEEEVTKHESKADNKNEPHTPVDSTVNKEQAQQPTENKNQSSEVKKEEPETEKVAMPSNMLFFRKPQPQQISESEIQEEKPIEKDTVSRIFEKKAEKTSKFGNRYNRITARELLQLFAGTRGYVTGSALPDESKAAKIIIRDFVNGRIPHFDVIDEDVDIKEAAFDELYNNMEDTSEHLMPIKNLKMSDLLFNEKQMGETGLYNGLQGMMDVNKELQLQKMAFLENISEQEILDLVEGKRVAGVKLEKGERRELKHLIKSDPPIEQVISLLAGIIFKGEGTNEFVKIKSQAVHKK